MVNDFIGVIDLLEVLLMCSFHYVFGNWLTLYNYCKCLSLMLKTVARVAFVRFDATLWPRAAITLYK